MAKSFKISTAARDAACNAIVDLVDAGSGAGTIKVYTGAAPTNPGDAASGTLLGTLTCSDPAFGASSTGTATASAITSDTSADNSGTAGYFRILDSDATVVMQGTAGLTGDTPNLVFDNATIVAGGTIAITALTVTVPQEGTA
jgi:hypothetical protein